MKILLLLTVVMISNTIASAQEYVDLAKVYYTLSPNNRFDSTDQTSDVQEIGAEILIPIPLENGSAIITGFAYDQTRIMPGPDAAKPVTLYTINPRFGVNWVHNEKWTGQYLLLPQLASDLKDGLNWHDAQMGVIAILSYKKREELIYKIGTYYNSALYGPGTFLIAGLYYTSPNENWTFDFTLPIWGDINYKLSERFSTGIRFDAMLRSYYVNKPLFTNDDEYIVKLSPDLYAYLQMAVARNFILQLKIGHSIGRHYRAFNIGDQIDLGFTGINIGDNRNQLSTDFEDGFIFQLRFHYRLFLNSNQRK